MVDRRYKIIYKQGKTFNSDVEFPFDAQTLEVLQNCTQIAMGNSEQIVYVVDTFNDALVASNDPNLFDNLDKLQYSNIDFKIGIDDIYSEILYFRVRNLDLFFEVTCPAEYGKLSSEDKKSCQIKVIEYTAKMFPHLISYFPMKFKYQTEDNITVYDFSDSEPYRFLIDNKTMTVCKDPETEEVIIVDDIQPRYDSEKKISIDNRYAINLAKKVDAEIRKGYLLSKPIKQIEIHNQYEDNFTCRFVFAVNVYNGNPQVELNYVDIITKYHYRDTKFKVQYHIADTTKNPVVKMCDSILITVPYDAPMDNNEIINTAKLDLDNIISYCTSMLVVDYAGYSADRLTWQVHRDDDMKVDTIDTEKEEVPPGIASMDLSIDGHDFNALFKYNLEYDEINVVSLSDHWFFKKSEMYIYYVMSKMLDKVMYECNLTYGFFTCADCTQSRTYEYIIQSIDGHHTFDNFYVHLVVPEGDIWCGPNENVCGKDHFRFDLSEPNQNMSRESYLKLKEQYFRIYSKEFEDFYMKYSAE